MVRSGAAALPGPTRTRTPEGDAISGGSKPEQQYAAWKTAITTFDSAGAIAKWATLHGVAGG